MARLVVREAVDRDVAEISDYYARESLDVAIRFLHAVRRAYEALLKMPGMGALRNFPNSRYAGVRSWPVKGFERILIFYRPIPDGIEIIRILHGARDLEKLFE
jgi:toxin ParE1/3/4